MISPPKFGPRSELTPSETILERQEQPPVGTLIGFKPHNVLPFKQHFTLGNLVLMMAENRLGQSALSRSVRPHQGVQLALVNDKVQPLQNLPRFDSGVEV